MSSRGSSVPMAAAFSPGLEERRVRKFSVASVQTSGEGFCEICGRLIRPGEKFYSIAVEFGDARQTTGERTLKVCDSCVVQAREELNHARALIH